MTLLIVLFLIALKALDAETRNYGKGYYIFDTRLRCLAKYNTRSQLPKHSGLFRKEGLCRNRNSDRFRQTGIRGAAIIMLCEKCVF